MDNKSKTKIDQYLQLANEIDAFSDTCRYSHFLFQRAVRNHPGCLYCIGDSPSSSRIPAQQG